MLKKVILALVLIFGIMQFFRIDKNNPEADGAKDFLVMTSAPDELAGLIKAACYDCHSHKVKYPWYTNIAPVSWWIKKHIDEGVESLNFSTWGDYPARKKAHKMQESYEEIEKANMPLRSYLIMHPEGKLDETQNQLLIDFFKSQEVHEVENKPGEREKLDENAGH